MAQCCRRISSLLVHTGGGQTLEERPHKSSPHRVLRCCSQTFSTEYMDTLSCKGQPQAAV